MHTDYQFWIAYWMKRTRSWMESLAQARQMGWKSTARLCLSGAKHSRKAMLGELERSANAR